MQNSIGTSITRGVSKQKSNPSYLILVIDVHLLDPKAQDSQSSHSGARKSTYLPLKVSKTRC